MTTSTAPASFTAGTSDGSSRAIDRSPDWTELARVVPSGTGLKTTLGYWPGSPK